MRLHVAAPALPHATSATSFDTFYAAWVGRVLAWLRALGVRPSDLDDAAQEVFLVVHRTLAKFDGRHPAAWLYRICTNVVRNHRRSAWLRKLIFSDHDDREQHLSPAPTAAEAHEENERLQSLYDLLNRIEPKRRATLWMFEVEGLSGEEIAQAQGVPLNTVWSRLRLARQDFAKLVKRARQMTPEEGQR